MRTEEGGRRKEEGERKKEEGGRKKKEGGRRKKEGGKRKEEVVENSSAFRCFLSFPVLILRVVFTLSSR
jgi:hypothetical protein